MYLNELFYTSLPTSPMVQPHIQLLKCSVVHFQWCLYQRVNSKCWGHRCQQQFEKYAISIDIVTAFSSTPVLKEAFKLTYLSTLLKIRHLWQLSIILLLHRFLICVLSIIFSLPSLFGGPGRSWFATRRSTSFATTWSRCRSFKTFCTLFTLRNLKE